MLALWADWQRKQWTVKFYFVLSRSVYLRLCVWYVHIRTGVCIHMCINIHVCCQTALQKVCTDLNSYQQCNTVVNSQFLENYLTDLYLHIFHYYWAPTWPWMLNVFRNKTRNYTSLKEAVLSQTVWLSVKHYIYQRFWKLKFSEAGWLRRKARFKIKQLKQNSKPIKMQYPSDVQRY